MDYLQEQLKITDCPSITQTYILPMNILPNTHTHTHIQALRAFYEDAESFGVRI